MSTPVPRRSNSTNPRPGTSVFPTLPRRPSDAPPLRTRPSDAPQPRQPSEAFPPFQPRRPSDAPLHTRRQSEAGPLPARLPLRPAAAGSSIRPTPQQSAPERTFPPNTTPRDSLRPAPLRVQRPTPQQSAPPRTFPSQPQTQPQPKRSSIFSDKNRPTRSGRPSPQQTAPQRTFGNSSSHKRQPSERVPLGVRRDSPQGQEGVDAATKTQINQTYAVTMMASSFMYNPLPFFLPVPIGVAMLLTGSSGGKGGGQGQGQGQTQGK
ncbi:hypothetical protein QBC38DRAFT_482140 [Podospora fimiseda]|uniref:Uncharacterized protein n=1 Tax=Podospora fimiseda TaxID=252190 RepID=A0AAN7BLZ5_9PEZI|nr:hypothetical protein QBC38DRAFT_482140 [Podospora fimiseda]